MYLKFVPILLVLAACGPERTKLNAAPLRPLGPVVIVGTDLYVLDEGTRLVKFSTGTPGPATVVATFPQAVERYVLGDTVVVAQSVQKSVFRAPLAGGEVTTLGPFTDVFGIATIGDRLFGLLHTGASEELITGALVEFPATGTREEELSSAHRGPVALRRSGDELAWLNRGRQRKSAAGVVLGHLESKVMQQRPVRVAAGPILESAGEIFVFELDADEIAWTDDAGLHRKPRVGGQARDLTLPAREDSEVAQLVLSDDVLWVRRSAPGGKDDLLRLDAEGAVSTVFDGADITGDVAVAAGSAYVPSGADLWRLTP